MLYRESYEIDPDPGDGEQYRNIALQQSAMLGPWLVISLGVTLMFFLIYLLYSSFFAPVQPMLASEHSLRLMTDTVMRPEREFLHVMPLRSFGTAITAIPHSRAANALLGGQGPALLPGSGGPASREAMEIPMSITGAPR